MFRESMVERIDSVSSAALRRMFLVLDMEQVPDTHIDSDHSSDSWHGFGESSDSQDGSDADDLSCDFQDADMVLLCVGHTIMVSANSSPSAMYRTSIRLT